MSKRAGGGNATVTRGLCVGYLHEMIEGIKSYKPEVKASKSDKRLRSYGHSKFSYWFSLAHERCSRLLNPAQTPSLGNFDIPGINGPTPCPIVWLPYAPEYVEKPLRESQVALFVYKCLTYSGAYGNHKTDHSVGPLVLTLFIDKYTDTARGIFDFCKQKLYHLT